MRLSAIAVVRGLLARRPLCPRCSGDRLVRSRRPYAVPWTRRLAFVAYRCRDCRLRFALRPRVAARIPAAPEAGAEPPAGEVARHRSRHRCPACGKHSLSRTGRQPAGWLDRLVQRTRFQCLECGHKFERTYKARIVGNALVVLALLAALGVSLSVVLQDASLLKKRPANTKAGPKRR